MSWNDLWARWRRQPAPQPQRHRAVESMPAPVLGRRMAGEYLPLHAYLDGRFADTVVLSFRQIESLLGFALPADAGREAGWWTATSPGPCHQDAWRLAHRTASPNLGARIVTFDRQV